MARYVLKWLCCFACVWITPVAYADWEVLEAGDFKIAEGILVADAPAGWNRSKDRIQSNSEVWTRDGPALNEISIFAGIEHNNALYDAYGSGTSPKFRKEMLLTDLVEFFEASNRHALQTSTFDLGKSEPTKLAGHSAVRFSYEYAIESDGLRHKGEAVAAIIEGKLYLVNFIAPSLYFFDRDLSIFRKIVGSLRFPAAVNDKAE